jgi:hypothetical protein
MKGKSGNINNDDFPNESGNEGVHKGKSGNMGDADNEEKPVQQQSEEELRNLFLEYTAKYTTDTLARRLNSLGSFSATGWEDYRIPNERIERIENQPNLHNEIFILDEELSTFYSGSVNRRNQKHGYGVLMKSNGERYEGYFENDVFQPYGRYINEKGEVFEGSFENWKLNGEGLMLKADKEYRGGFFYGLRNGQGIENSETERYEGLFKNDKKDGQGVLDFKKTGNKYIGDFKDGKMTGNCDFQWKNGDRYVGNIVNGVFDGRGKYYWDDGMEYEGNYEKGIRRGFGIFKWKDGKIYKGEFEDNLPHGNGVIIHNGIEKNVKSHRGQTLNASVTASQQGGEMKKEGTIEKAHAQEINRPKEDIEAK